MNRLFSDVYRWVDDRLGIRGIMTALFDEPIPGGARWSYVFGSALLFVFVLQFLTGIFLTMYYVPSAEHAHTTVAYIQKVVTGGGFIRGLHHWASSMMIVLLVVHMLQVFFWGAYKAPREMVWIFGSVLLLLIVGFAFTGYLLPWDQKSYFATAVGTSVASEVPLVGIFLKSLALGGANLGTITLSRFFMVHTMVLPASTVLFVLLHIYAFRKAGPAGPYKAEDSRSQRIELFYPKQFFYDSAFAVIMFAILATLAVTQPAVLEPKANPADSLYRARPEWYFLPLFQLLKIFNGELAIIAAVIIPGVLFGLLFLVPFIDRNSERNPFRRRIASVSMILILVTLGSLFFLAKKDDGAFMASADVERLLATPPEQINQLSPLDRKLRDAAENRMMLDKQAGLAGKFLAEDFHPYESGLVASQKKKSLPPPPPQYGKHCAECHGELGGNNGLLGPDLINVGGKYTPEQLNQIIQDPERFGITGGMVGFREDQLSTSERLALIEYLIGLTKK